MDVQEIDVYIDNEGRVQIKVQGVKGDSCLQITRSLEKVLGGEVVSREMTAEAYETAEENVYAEQKMEF